MRTETPTSLVELAELARECATTSQVLRPAGSGYEQGLGYAVDPDVVVDMRAMASIRDFDPDELVIRVDAGTTVGTLQDELAASGLRSTVTGTPAARTVGGALASAASGIARLRHGPVRNHVIGVTLVSGPGDVVHAGGQVVKNVTGYDISRLSVGSLGRLGVIAEVTLRVFPVRGQQVKVRVADPGAASVGPARPLGVVATRTEAIALIEGTEAAIDAVINRLEGDLLPADHPIPEPGAWSWRATIRSRPSDQAGLIGQLPEEWQYIAQYGVGFTEVGGDSFDAATAASMRREVEDRRGRFVLHRVPAEARGAMDPWGLPPPDLEIQRRIVAAFDPSGIYNPGILPGGL